MNMKLDMSAPYRYQYNQLLQSGMFWEIYPQLSGNWEKDKKEFIKQEKYLNNHFRGKGNNGIKSKDIK